MKTLATSHKLQLMQLQKLDPQAARIANVALSNGWPSTAVTIITKAMQAALTRLVNAKPASDPAADIYTALVNHIEAGKPIHVKGLTQIYSDNSIQAHLKRDDNNRLRLVVYRNAVPVSAQVGYWGNDTSRISGRSGCWKIAAGARESIARMIKDGKQ